MQLPPWDPFCSWSRFFSGTAWVCTYLTRRLLKRTYRSSPSSQHSYFRNEAGRGQCCDDLVQAKRTADRTVSGGMRELQAVAPAPARGRTDTRVDLGPLEGGQELAGKSQAGSGATAQTGVHLKWVESWFPAKNIDRAQLQLPGKSSDLFSVQCHALDLGHCLQCACVNKSVHGLFRKWNQIVNIFSGLQLVESLADSWRSVFL